MNQPAATSASRSGRRLGWLRNGAGIVLALTLGLALPASFVLNGKLGMVASGCEEAPSPGTAPSCRGRSGVWHQPRLASGELRLIASGGATLLIDGREVLVRRPEARARAVRERVSLAAGLRRIEVLTEKPGQPFEVVWKEDDRPAQALGPLFREQTTPGLTRLANALRTAQAGLRVMTPVWIILALLAGLVTGSRAAGAHACAAVLFGASLLGGESIVRRNVAEPSLPAEVLTGIAPALRPGNWSQGPEAYYGDPPDYLARARRLQGFYDGEAREPVYVALVRVALSFTRGDETALGLSSAASWIVYLGAIYAVAARVVGNRLALVALLLLASDRDLIGLAAMGERDQTFAAAFAWSILAFLRVWERPTASRGIVFGLAAAIATLTRISSLSYVAPALMLLALRRAEDGTQPRRAAWLGAATLTALVAPYLISCGIAFGDPLRSINIHTGYYRSNESQPRPAGQNVAQYLFAGRSPLERLDTAAGGLMEASFGRPFPALGVWVGAGAASTLSVIAWLGLLALRGPGVLVLLLTVLAAVPFSLTWNIGGGGDLRFVLFALMATAISAAAGLGLIGSLAARNRDERTTAWRALALALSFAAVLFVARVGLRGTKLHVDGANGREVFVSGHPLDIAVVRGFVWRPEPLGGQYLRASARDPRLDLRLQAGRKWQATLRWWSAQPVELSEDGRRVATLPAVAADQMGHAVITLDPSAETHRVIRFRGPVSLWWARVAVDPEN